MIQFNSMKELPFEIKFIYFMYGLLSSIVLMSLGIFIFKVIS